MVYATLGLVVRQQDDEAEERCLCGALRGHPTARWPNTARSIVTA